MASEAPTALLLFCRTPGAEAGKTRLAACLGPAAVSIYEACFLDVLEMTVADAWWRTVLCCSPPGSDSRLRSWLAGRPVAPTLTTALNSIPIWSQEGGDLGDRMGRALDRALRSGYASAAILGTDIPGMPPGSLDACWNGLETADVVIGPALDGGFYLVALSGKAGVPKAAANLFAGINWTGGDTLEPVLRNARQRDLRVKLLPLWMDLDVKEDLVVAHRLLRSYAAAGEDVAPRTRSLLNELTAAGGLGGET